MNCEGNSHSQILSSLNAQGALYDKNDLFSGVVSVGGTPEERALSIAGLTLDNIAKNTTGHNIDQALEDIPQADQDTFREILDVYPDDRQRAAELMVEFSNIPAPEVNYYLQIVENADPFWVSPNDDVFASPTSADYMQALQAVDSSHYPELFEGIPEDVQQEFLAVLSGDPSNAEDVSRFENFAEHCSQREINPQPAAVPTSTLNVSPD